MKPLVKIKMVPVREKPFVPLGYVLTPEGWVQTKKFRRRVTRVRWLIYGGWSVAALLFLIVIFGR